MYRRRKKLFRLPNPKVVWQHDAATIRRLLQRFEYDKKRARILRALHLVRAGLSYSRVMVMTGEKRVNLFDWVRFYNKFGMANLLGIKVSVPDFARRRILNFAQHHTVTVADAEAIGVEIEVLVNWLVEKDLNGY